MRKLLFCLTFISLVGCYSKNFNEPEVISRERWRTDRDFTTSFNTTWDALIVVLKDVPILSAKRESGILVTDWINGKSDRLFSTYDKTRIPYKIRYKMLIKLKGKQPGTNVTVRNHEQYYADSLTQGGNFSGSLYSWSDTESSTLKEKSLLDALQEQLEKSAPGEGAHSH